MGYPSGDMDASTLENTTRYVRILILAIFSLAICPLLRAETAIDPDPSPNRPPGERETLIWKCRSCRLTLLDREIIQGRLLDVRTDSLEIESHVVRYDRDPFTPKVKEFHRRTVALDEIASVRCGDPVWNGVVAGTLIASLPTFWVTYALSSADEGGAQVDTEWGIVGASTAIAAGIGAGLGFLIDWADGPRYDPDLETVRRAAGE